MQALFFRLVSISAFLTGEEELEQLIGLAEYQWFCGHKVKAISFD